MTAQAIIDEYRHTGSIRKTSGLLGISEQSVRRTLITAGEHQGDRSLFITDSIRAGKTTAEIAATLGIKPKTIHTHLPYSRGPYYIHNKSRNARKIAAWRANRRVKNGA